MVLLFATIAPLEHIVILLVAYSPVLHALPVIIALESPLVLEVVHILAVHPLYLKGQMVKFDAPSARFALLA